DKARTLARRSAHAALGNTAEQAVLGQLVDAFIQVGRTPEAAFDDARMIEHARLLPELHEENVPGADRHDAEDDDHDADHEVAILPERYETVGTVRAHGGRRRR